MGGAGCVVLQGGNPAHYKLGCTDEITMTDIVFKDVLLAHKSFTVHTYSVRDDCIGDTVFPFIKGRNIEIA